MKILIEESVLRQALEALVFLGNDDLVEVRALSTALDAAENVEPAAWMSPDGKVSAKEGVVFHKPLYAAPIPPTNTEKHTVYVSKPNDPFNWGATNTDSEPRRVLPIIPAEESDKEFVRQVEATQCMDDSELRDAARAVVEWWDSEEAIVGYERFDRLRKALG